MTRKAQPFTSYRQTDSSRPTYRYTINTGHSSHKSSYHNPSYSHRQSNPSYPYNANPYNANPYNANPYNSPSHSYRDSQSHDNHTTIPHKPFIMPTVSRTILYITISILIILITLMSALHCYITCKNNHLITLLRTPEAQRARQDLIMPDTASTYILMNSCIIDGEECLAIFPLLDVSAIFETSMTFHSELKDQPYYRHKYFKTMLAYFRDRRVLRYVPARNISRHIMADARFAFDILQFTRLSTGSPLVSSLNLVSMVFGRHTFVQHNETFIMCILSASYVDVVKYDFSGDQFVMDRTCSFYFPDGLAVDCFAYVLDALAERAGVAAIDAMMRTLDNSGRKMRMRSTI